MGMPPKGRETLWPDHGWKRLVASTPTGKTEQDLGEIKRSLPAGTSAMPEQPARFSGTLRDNRSRAQGHTLLDSPNLGNLLWEQCGGAHGAYLAGPFSRPQGVRSRSVFQEMKFPLPVPQ